MPENESTMRYKVDISQLKSAMADAKRSISLANAEFKNATAAMGKWSKSTTGLEAKIKQLTTTNKQEKTILASLEQQYELVAEQMGEDSSEAQRLKIQIENQKATIKGTESQLAHYNSALQELQDEQRAAESPMGKLNKTIDEQEDELGKLKKAYANATLEFGENSDEARKLADDIDDLSKELKENKEQLNKAEKAADEFDHSLDDMGDGADGAGGKFGSMTVAIGNLVAEGIQMALTALKDFATETIEVGRQFDTSMSSVAALSGATGDELEMLRDTAKEFGASTVFSASESADALGYMALAGWDAQQSTDALGGVLNLAAASGMDLAKASDMVTDYMSAFNMTADQSAYFADLLAYAQGNANTTAEGLGEAYKNCAANMNAAGQDIETTTALLSMMANQGLKGSEAGTALTAVMRDMTAKMQDGKIAIGDTSVEVMDAQGNFRDMTDILRDVEAATDGMGDAQKSSALMSTFTSDSIKGLNLILNAGVDNAAAFEDELRNCSGTAEEMSEVMNDNLGGDLTALNSKLEGVQIQLYEKLEPALRAGVDVLSSLLDGVQKVIDTMDKWMPVLVGVTAAVSTFLLIINWGTIMTAAASALQKVIGAIKLLGTTIMTNPIGLLVSVIVGLVAAFIYLWNTSEKFRNFWIGLWENIKSVAGGVVDAVVGFFTGAWDKIKAVWETVSEFFVGVWDGIKTVFQPVADFFGTIFGNVWIVIENIWTLIKWLFEREVEGWKRIFTPIIEFFSNTFGAAWDKIKAVWETVSGFFQGVWNKVSSIFGNVVGFFKSKFQAAWNAIKNVFSPVGKFFGGIWNTIKEKFTNIGQKVGDAIKGVFKAAINGLLTSAENILNAPINAVNSLIDKINSVPGISLSKLNTFSLPRMALGGVLTSARAVIAGEDGAEAIVPLERNRQWIAAVAREMVAQLDVESVKSGVASSVSVAAANGGGIGARVVNQTNNFYQTNNSPDALDRLGIYRDTKSLFFSAKVGLANV